MYALTMSEIGAKDEGVSIHDIIKGDTSEKGPPNNLELVNIVNIDAANPRDALKALASHDTKEDVAKNEVPVPHYDENLQIKPPYGEEAYGYRNPGLYAIAVEYTKQARELSAKAGIPITAAGGLGLEWAVDHTSKEIGRHFDVHGFGAKTDLSDLDKILSDGIRPDRTLFTMPFIRGEKGMEAFGAEIPKRERGIYLISDYGKKITEKDGGIKYVGVGEEYVNAIDEMRRQWPGVEIVPWHDLPQVLTENYNLHTGENKPYQKPDEENKPRYAPKRFGTTVRDENKSVLIPGASSEGGEVW